MRDLVETIIGQVLKREPTMKPLENKQANGAQGQSFQSLTYKNENSTYFRLR